MVVNILTQLQWAEDECCQSLNAEFSKDGIHVAHVIIDGAVDAPDTLGKMLGPELFEQFKERKEKNGMILPEEVAETYLFIAKQKKSTWTHEIDIRAFSRPSLVESLIFY